MVKIDLFPNVVIHCIDIYGEHRTFKYNMPKATLETFKDVHYYHRTICGEMMNCLLVKKRGKAKDL